MPLTKKQRAFLCGSFLFYGVETEADCPPALFEQLRVLSFQAGEPIYSRHRFRREIGILTRGHAIVRNAAGVELNLLHAGDCFGVAALWSGASEYVSDVRAKTACEALFLSQEQLRALFALYPQTAINYIAFLSDRINFLNKRIDGFTAPCALAVVCLYLREHAANGVVEVGAGYSALARALNLGRASLYRALDELQGRGAIRREGRTIFIQNSDLLLPTEGRIPREEPQ